MKIVNVDFIPEKELEVMDIVKGSMVMSKHLGKDIMAGLKTLVGGELKGYTEMLEDAREGAFNRMKEQAEKMGADAIINVRYASSYIMPGSAEILVYGTAVRYK